jgi:hypothetical protein
MSEERESGTIELYCEVKWWLLKKLSAPGALFIWIALDENCKH